MKAIFMNSAISLLFLVVSYFLQTGSVPIKSKNVIWTFFGSDILYNQGIDSNTKMYSKSH